MKKILISILMITVILTACAQDKNITDMSVQNAEKQPSEEVNQVLGFAFSSVNSDKIESDLAGIKIGDKYIDDVASLTIDGTTIEKLYDDGVFNDIFENVKLDCFYKLKAYYICENKVYTSEIDKVDVIFGQGMGEFFIKIYSSIPEQSLSNQTDKFVCLISEQEPNIEAVSNDVNNSANQQISENSILSTIKINDIVHILVYNKGETFETYEVYLSDWQKIFELVYSEA